MVYLIKEEESTYEINFYINKRYVKHSTLGYRNETTD